MKGGGAYIRRLKPARVGSVLMLSGRGFIMVYYLEFTVLSGVTVPPNHPGGMANM